MCAMVMNAEAEKWSRRCESALRRYMKHGAAANLGPALRPGRQAAASSNRHLKTNIIKRNQVAAGLKKNVSESTKLLREQTRQIMSDQEKERKKTSLQLQNEVAQTLLAINIGLWALKKAAQASSLDFSKELANTQRLVRESLKRVNGQEEERKRISLELHDVVTQLLSGINAQLANLKKDAASNTNGIKRKISAAQRLVKKSVDVLHRFARELRPAVLDDFGLVPALHSFLKGFIKETGIQASLTAVRGLEKLSDTKRIVLYRVAQEALKNVARHAKASRVDVSVERLPAAVRMRVLDNGLGFDVTKEAQSKKGRHGGLLGMRERVEMVGGAFAIESAPGKGTVILACVPFRAAVKERVLP